MKVIQTKAGLWYVVDNTGKILHGGFANKALAERFLN